MARNEEKQVTRLNRLLLQQQREEEEKKNPKRPKLNTLNSIADIQKWLPSLKKDIDFYLMQSQVPCYPARKIEEFSHEIDRLKREYQAFVRKLRQLDPSVKTIPWTERGYSARKRPVDSTVADDVTSIKLPTVGEFKTTDTSASRSPDRHGYANASHHGNSAQAFVPIVTPILEKEENFRNLYGYQDARAKVTLDFPQFDLEDKPLQFAGVSDQTVFSETCQPKNSKLEINNPAKPGNVQLENAASAKKWEVHVSSGHSSSVETLKGDNSPQKNFLLNLADMYGGSSSESEDSRESSVI
ncbi:uncharacterized protein LOC135471476 [Liolophura sinensis]|uniref:uncharacterized protein LOC135471476 n=1 Tax=Liolophura sinensis TaxID=3198878 RepID=UPI003158FA78